MGKLDGKVALVTGAASGIGASTARLFAAEGAKVVLADVSDAGSVADEIGDAAFAVKLDVRDSGAWQSAVDSALARFGALHILVNNAGIMSYGLLDQLTEEEIRRTIDVNLMGAILGTRTVVAPIEKAGGGAIVNVSSVDGLFAHNALSHYVASKWGLRGYTKASALELTHRGIRVNSVHPGGVFTPMSGSNEIGKAEFDAANMRGYPIQRSCTPEEIAKAILFLAGPDGSYCSGTELAVDGGMTSGQYFSFLPGSPPQ